MGFRIALALLAICAVLIIGRSIPIKEHRTKTNQTITLLVYVSENFDALETNDSQHWISSLQPHADSLAFNRQLVLLLASRTNNFRPLNGLISPDGLFRDAWGTPLYFLLTNDPTYGEINPQLKSRGRPFVLWSAGPNLTNELGFGDDLFPDKH
jgi:hypothetical protein